MSVGPGTAAGADGSCGAPGDFFGTRGAGVWGDGEAGLGVAVVTVLASADALGPGAGTELGDGATALATERSGSGADPGTATSLARPTRSGAPGEPMTAIPPTTRRTEAPAITKPSAGDLELASSAAPPRRENTRAMRDAEACAAP